MQWPTITKATSQASLEVDPNETGLVSGWNMKPVNNTVVDQGPYGNNGTLSSNISFEKTPLGDTAVFQAGHNGIQINGVGGDVDVTKGTLSGWINLDDYASSTYKHLFFISYSSGHRIRLGADNNNKLSAYYQSSSTKQVTTSIALYRGWIHVGMTWDTTAGELKMYINGVQSGSTVTGLSVIDTAFSSASIGINGTGGSERFLGKAVKPEMFNEVKSENWFAKEYAKGRTALFKTDFCANASVASEGGTIGAFLSNTPFQFGDTTCRYKVSSDTINGTPVKVIECTTAGVVYIPTSVFGQTPTEAAYGTWEFWANKTDTGSIYIYFINDLSVLTSSNGYYTLLTGGEAVSSGTRTAGSNVADFTSSEVISANQWNRFKVTRTPAGIFTTYLNDTSITANTGNNPFTDTTFTTSNYIVLDLDAGDKIALSDVGGNLAFKKTLTV